ncbi:MAG: hypothetical protein EOP06_23715 [Proteobacteria bacterium]|nr:MAG: hypothetical protein EOP06_23715 [Pseudomonadota bacterium]
MRLTSRDKKLLAKLQTYGCLTTRQIRSLCFHDIALTTVLRRLRALEHDGFVQKILGLETAERLWALTKKSVDQFSFSSAKIHFPRAILEHDSLLSTLRMRLEETDVIQSWIPEHEIRKRVAAKHGLAELKRRVIPDGIMSVRINEANESVAVELELSNKNQERYRQILHDYSNKQTLYAVWYVVNSSTIRKQIEHAKDDTYFDFRKTNIFFSDIDDVLKDPLAAALSNGKESRSLRDLFSLRAHPSAHGVSGSDIDIVAAPEPVK